jgi:hypothetical protein
MGLVTNDLTTLSNAQTEILTARAQLERIADAVAVILPETGTDDVIRGGVRAMDRALDKLHFETGEAMRAERGAYNRSEGA